MDGVRVFFTFGGVILFIYLVSRFMNRASVESYKNVVDRNSYSKSAIPGVDIPGITTPLAPSAMGVGSINSSAKDKQKQYLTRPQMQGIHILDGVGRNPNWNFRYSTPIRKSNDTAFGGIYRVDYEQAGGIHNAF